MGSEYTASMKSISQDLLNEMTDRLAAEFQPEQVWLFGSHAWGQPDEGSDIDLLVVVRDSQEPSVRRAQRAHRCLSGLGVAKDVLVKTRAELERFSRVPSSSKRRSSKGAGSCMDDAKRELVRAWLLKARSDLDTARQVGSHPEGHLDAAIYHCQQAAEKAVKGYLPFGTIAWNARTTWNGW